MPHTSRQKRPAAPTQKRLQVTDDDGWTHVTSSTNVRRVLHKTRTKTSNEQDSNAQPTAQDSPEINGSGVTELVLGPAEAPGRLTLDELQAQYRGYREKWITSETWTRLVAQLNERIVSASAPVDAIVCVGLGSPSGFLRGGWVDRRSVSMYQLAALESIAQWISETTPNNEIPIYAQDPVFNPLDKSLLTSLNIRVLTHPAAFTLLTKRTLLFCPGAERKHLEQLLASEPCMVFGGPLEDTNSDVIQGFVGRVRSVELGLFEGCEHAFWKTRVYFREEDEGEGGVGVDV